MAALYRKSLSTSFYGFFVSILLFTFSVIEKKADGWMGWAWSSLFLLVGPIFPIPPSYQAAIPEVRMDENRTDLPVRDPHRGGTNLHHQAIRRTHTPDEVGRENSPAGNGSGRS